MVQVVSMETPPMRRPRGRVVVAVVFGLLALNAWWQVIADISGMSSEPRLLTGWQALCGVLAVAAAWGSWAGAAWVPAVAVLYGIVAGAMVVGLGPILDLPAESRNGLWTGGAIVLAFGLWSAWWLRRSLRRERARETSHIVGFD
jgi:hypothetical protein